MIYNTKLFKEIFLLALVVAVLHNVAISLSFYWLFPWFDIMMHFLGGLWSGLFIVWLVIWQKNNYDFSLKKYLILGLAGALIIGTIWELFELVTKLTFLETNFITDTILDFIMDSIGGLIAGFYSFKKLSNKL
jgi:hypothetical protein